MRAMRRRESAREEILRRLRQFARYRTDVGIKDGKIAKLGRLTAHEAKKVIDAEGQYVVRSERDGTLRISGVGGNPRRRKRATPAVGHTKPCPRVNAPRVMQ